MRRVLFIKRTRREPPGHYGTDLGGRRGASQSCEAQGAGGFSTEPGFDPRRLGYRSESAPRRSQSSVCESHPRTDAIVSGAGCADSPVARVSEAQCAQGLLKTVVLALISFYRATLSPVIPSSCRFYPTCSVYAYEAVSQWGIRRGIWLALRRVLRCRPLGDFGYDPVPQSSRRSDPRGGPGQAQGLPYGMCKS